MAAIDPDNPPIAAIRELLTTAFTPQTLVRFCTDRPAFRPVVHRLGPGHGLADMVDRVIEHCGTMLLWDELLAGVQEVSPRRYERFVAGLDHTTPPVTPARAAGQGGAGSSVFNQQGQTVGTQINIAGSVYGPVTGVSAPDAPAAGADTAGLRARLQRLDAVEIESLCLDHFPEVYDRFGRGLRRDEMVNLLLDHCRRNQGEAARLAALLG